MTSSTHSTLTAHPANDATDAQALHARLNCFNRARLMPVGDAVDWEPRILRECELRRIECHFVERERVAVGPLCAPAPTDADAFVR